MSRLMLLVLVTQVHQVINTPLRTNEKEALHIKTSSNIPLLVNAKHEELKVPVLVPLEQSQHVGILDPKLPNMRKKKGPNIPVSLPIPHHLLVSNLHVIPIHSNIHQHSVIHSDPNIHQHNVIHTDPTIHHNSIHSGVKLVTNEHINVPIVTHTFSHSISNVTHSTPLIPILIPIHTHLVPLHDLKVIPLHRPLHSVDQKLSHYRVSMEKKDTEEEEPINRFRSFYGGYGNGLYIGGHGAGHGFYAYG